MNYLRVIFDSEGLNRGFSLLGKWSKKIFFAEKIGTLRVSSDEMRYVRVMRLMRGAPLERTLSDLSRDLIAITPFARSTLCFVAFKSLNRTKTLN